MTCNESKFKLYLFTSVTNANKSDKYTMVYVILPIPQTNPVVSTAILAAKSDVGLEVGGNFELDLKGSRVGLAVGGFG